MAKPLTDSNTTFFEYKPPLTEPTLIIKHDIPYTLSQVINYAFKKMLKEPNKELSNDLSDLKKLVKFKQRINTKTIKSTSNQGIFKGNNSHNNCEILEYDSQLIPLLPDYNMDKIKQSLEESESKNENNNEINNNNNDNSWTSWNSWKKWGGSWIDSKAWGGTINTIIKALNQYINAKELWKIDWTLNKACSIIESTSMSYVITVNEYCIFNEIEVDTNDDDNNGKKKIVKFIKKLYINPIVSLPQTIMDSMSGEYKNDSELQMKIIERLCKLGIESEKKKNIDNNNNDKNEENNESNKNDETKEEE